MIAGQSADELAAWDRAADLQKRIRRLEEYGLADSRTDSERAVAARKIARLRAELSALQTGEHG